jgi:hypothetical protein
MLRPALTEVLRDRRTMMRRLMTAALVVALVPSTLAAQGLGLGTKIGTLGYGLDVGLGLGGTFVLRGGVAFAPDDLFVTRWIPADISGIDYALQPPTTTFSLGMDAHLLGPLKLMGGVLYRNDDLVARGETNGPVQIGSSTYDTGGTVWATLDQSSFLPYFGLGLGRLDASGFGVYLDLVMAYSSSAEVVMTASPDFLLIPGFQSDLQAEADEFAEDAGMIKNLYPMLQFGLKYGLGR